MTARDRRALIAGACALLALLAIRAVPAARAAARDAVAELEQARGLAAHAGQLLARAPGLPDSLAVRNARLLRLAPLRLGGTPAAEASAALAALLNGWAATHGVSVNRLQPRPDSLNAPFTRVAVALDGQSDLEGVARLLTAIESAPQLLSVAVVEMDAEGDDATLRLRVHLVVHAWTLFREPA